MKNEIKEILNEIGYHQHIHENLTLSPKELDILADSIIDSQEELKSANESITWWQNRFNALQKENEKLKEIIKDNIILVKDENGNYQECNVNPLDYKSRIDKAIEYIKQCSWSNGIDEEIQYSLYVPTLLNILTGGDEE